MPIKKKLRNYNFEKTHSLIQNILETTNSIKTIKKNLLLGTKCINYLADKSNKKGSDRL